MAKNILPEIEEDKRSNGTRGSSQQILLLVLLFLVLVFGYLYFFTNVIRQREEVAKAPPAQTAQVRQPLPPRPDQGGEKPAAAKPEEKPPTQAKPEKPVSPPAPPQAKPVPPQVKPAPPQVKPVSPQTKPAPPQAKPAAVPPQPAPAKAVKAEEKPLHKEQAKASPAPVQPAATEHKAGAKPVAAATAAAKKAPAAVAARQAAKPAAEQGAFALLVGEFAVDKEMKSTRAKLKKLGVTPVHEKKVEKLQTMHRLFLADFDSHYAADIELQKLAKVCSSTFILEQNGRYAVYAGSYLHERGAAAEQKRLAGKGFKLGIKTAKVMVPVKRVTAGSFSSSPDALNEASRLNKQGITARVIKTGK
jgi:cytoskeletal protein RodZ